MANLETILPPNIIGNLQNTLDNGTFAEFDNGNSYVNILNGIVNDRSFEFSMENGIAYPNKKSSYFYADNDSFELQNKAGVILGDIGIYNGNITLTQSNFSNLGNTTLIFNSPISSSILKLPSKSIDGIYNLATSVDGVESDSTGNINISSVDQLINGKKTYSNHILFSSTKGIISNDMTFSGSSTGLAQWVLSSNIDGNSGRLHIEPKGKFFTGTKSKLDWMFDAYQLDQLNYRLFNIYNTDDFSLGTNGITTLNCKSQGDDNYGMYPIMHFGFQDDGNNSQPMKISYFDTTETSWRTTYKGAWMETKPVLIGDFVTANFNLYVATSSGNCGVTKPIHSSGTVSDGSVTWTFVKTFVSTNIKPTVLFGDRSDMPKFGFPTSRVQFAKDQIHWYNTFSRYLDNTDTDIVQQASYSTGLRISTTGGFKIEIENTAQNWILRNSGNTGVYRMMANGSITNAIDIVNKGHLDTQLTLKANISAPTFTTSITAPIIISTTTIRLKNYTVSTLPTGTQGDVAYVTDALTPTYLGALVGGGAVKCPVFHNGTMWISH